MKKLLTILVMLLFSLPVFGITAHLPTYIITGDKEDQLTFFVNADQELVKNTSVYLSYCLKAKWNIYDKSAPFQYYNHNPSLFWQIQNVWKFDLLRIIPYEHVSNGLDGWKSRGMDRYFGEAQISHGKIFNIGINEKAGGYYGYTKRKEIPSPKRIYGYFKTSLFMQIKDKHGYFGHERLALTGEWTKRFYWYQIDFSVRIITAKFSPHLYIQYYNGYGEFLNNYHKKTNSLRAGLIFYP